MLPRTHFLAGQRRPPDVRLKVFDTTSFNTLPAQSPIRLQHLALTTTTATTTGTDYGASFDLIYISPLRYV